MGMAITLLGPGRAASATSGLDNKGTFSWWSLKELEHFAFPYSALAKSCAKFVQGHYEMTADEDIMNFLVQ